MKRPFAIAALSAALVGGCGGDSGPGQDRGANAPAAAESGEPRGPSETNETAPVTAPTETITERVMADAGRIVAGPAGRAAISFMVLLSANKNGAACEVLKPSLRRQFSTLYKTCPRGIEDEAPVGESIIFDRPAVRAAKQRRPAGRVRVRVTDRADGDFATMHLTDTAKGWRITGTYPHIGTG